MSTKTRTRLRLGGPRFFVDRFRPALCPEGAQTTAQPLQKLLASQRRRQVCRHFFGFHHLEERRQLAIDIVENLLGRDLLREARRLRTQRDSQRERREGRRREPYPILRRPAFEERRRPVGVRLSCGVSSLSRSWGGDGAWTLPSRSSCTCKRLCPSGCSLVRRRQPHAPSSSCTSRNTCTLTIGPGTNTDCRYIRNRR